MRSVRHHSKTVLVIGALGLAGLVGFDRPAPLIVYNASASAPVGFYRVSALEWVRRGDLVLVRTPNSVRSLAAERGYLPATVPLVKRVAAMDGDAVCVVDRTVFIDGRPVASQLSADRLSRPLPAWTGCRILDPDELFLLMAGVPDSFDSRYFGPVKVDSVIGKLNPLWLR